MSLTKTLHGQEDLKFVPARESLVSDIQAGDGKIANICLQCTPEYTEEVLRVYNSAPLLYM
jgi:hypothetical protein